MKKQLPCLSLKVQEDQLHELGIQPLYWSNPIAALSVSMQVKNTVHKD